VTESPLAVRVERVTRFLNETAEAACGLCGRALCGHQALMSLAAGRQDAPLCLGCLSEDLAKPATALRDQLVGYILRKECLTLGWGLASAREGLAASEAPACLWPKGGVAAPAEAAPPTSADEAPTASARWDAGDMGCGDLVLELRRRLETVPAGGVLWLSARDPGAPEDLPAWCRLTGNDLAFARHPDYWIRRRA
jgi:tRNA 2-thiouridine synthesizing protein A